jgi:branched-chain amino acid transport system ATP-binding protein
LSGGEQQMVAIARGLTTELFAMLADLRYEGVTIPLVDEMEALVLKVADRGYVLQSGRIVQEGSAEALAHDPVLEATYLGRLETVE